MTKKHFITLAAALRSTQASDATIAAVAAVCVNASRKFDHAKFLAAAKSEPIP